LRLIRSSAVESNGSPDWRHGTGAHNLPARFRCRRRPDGLGSPVAEQWRLVVTYTGRILRGDMSGNLPVQQSTRLDLTINMKAVKRLGLTVPLPC
jgi:putative ABC transport system substrate-binding protein